MRGLLTPLLKNGIPTKGAILTLLSAKWFDVLSKGVPGLKHHFLHLGPPTTPNLLTADEQKMLRGRSMTVRYVDAPIHSIRLGMLTFTQQPAQDLPY